MLKFFRVLFLSLFICKAHAVDVRQHESAIEMESSTVSSLLNRSLNPHHQNNHRSDDTLEIRSPDSTHLGIYQRKGARNWYVFFNDTLSTEQNNVVELSEDHKFTGCVRRDLHRLAKQIINSEIFRYENGKDYVFSGYGNGGSFAYLLAAEFYKRLPTEAQENQRRNNTIKVIAFHPKPVGDADFASSFAETLAPVNVFYFRSYYLFNTFDKNGYVPGVPLYITPFEWFTNSEEDNINIALMYTKEVCKTTDTPIYEAGKPGSVPINRGFLRSIRNIKERSYCLSFCTK